MSLIYDNASLKDRVKRVLEDDFKHEAIKRAQEVIGSKRDALVEEQGETWNQLRDKASTIRDHVLNNLDFYVKQFAENAEANGCKVYFAPKGEDAVEVAIDIFEELGEKVCVKAKSMITEEIGLNEELEKVGISAIETDCAEHIIQTAGDVPSHIVVPALHFDRNSIRDLYHEKLGYEGSEEPEEITRFLRKTLRPQFISSKVGITGCNFAVAETGSCTLVTNEGNGRMVTCEPETQIIMLGTERIVPDLKSLDTFMALLVRSAVGSKITSSFSITTGPRRKGEVDGPANVHIIIVDNGRSRILESNYNSMLRCIRCGACMNICPVYRHITGHGYGSIYPGPMGLVLTPLFEGYEKIGKLESACTLCGACADVCPVEIPLNKLILNHRNDIVDQGYAPKSERMVFGAAARFLANRNLYGSGTKIGSFGMKVLGGSSKRLGEGTAWMPVVKGWTSVRNLDTMAPRKFREVFAEYQSQQKKEEEQS